ncbi:hypothetical protein Scep_012258 [Stephania cephalantha]|uniref:Uncharacterized protein n=1 Tax=Stephania cephalantha TaxID=152367 RepID=A0AAP0P9C6_9MAGN
MLFCLFLQNIKKKFFLLKTIERERKRGKKGERQRREEKERDGGGGGESKRLRRGAPRGAPQAR